MEKGRQTQVNPGLGKLHSYIAYRRRMALNIGQLGLDAIGRMGGHGYARTRDYSDLPTRSLQAWTEAPGGGERFWPEPK